MNTTELRALAESATPGPLVQGYNGTDIRQGDKPDDYGMIIA